MTDASPTPRWHVAATTFGTWGILIAVAVLGVGVWNALTRVPSTSDSRVQICLGVVLVLVAWLGITSLVSRTNAYQRSSMAVALVIVLPVSVALFVLGHLALVSDLLDMTPVSWLIGFQGFRVVGGVFLIAWLAGGVEKPWFCVWAGSIDVALAVAALPVAWWASTGSSAALATGVAWNVIGLLDFVVAIAIQHVDRTVLRDFFHTNRPLALALKPMVLVIFTYGVPVMAIVHVLSIRQLT